MAHYAFLDANNVVTEVIVGNDEGNDGINWEQHYGAFRGQICKRTSYNTRGGIHAGGGIPFRKNYASIGFSYDEQRDAFIPPQPYPHWVLNEQTCLWQPPALKEQLAAATKLPAGNISATEQWVALGLQIVQPEPVAEQIDPDNENPSF